MFFRSLCGLAIRYIKAVTPSATRRRPTTVITSKGHCHSNLALDAKAETTIRDQKGSANTRSQSRTPPEFKSVAYILDIDADVVVKSMVAFWVLNLRWHLEFVGPKRGP